MKVTTNLKGCPDSEVLSDFLLGKRDSEELDSIARHLDTCTKCSAMARSLESRTDTLIDTLRQAIEEDAFTEEPSCFEGSKAVASRQFSMPSPRPDPRLAEKPLGHLGTYELLEEIGRGGAGVVYRARHTRLKTIVAVKVLPAEALTRPDMLARFDREMAAIGQLEHPHIVHATDAGDDEGRHFLVMEYVEGGNLAALVDRQGPLPVAEATACILQAARGLSYSHAKGMVHRDVKPSNLLLGADGIIKVSDLGLARVLLNVEEDGSTHTGSLMGTFDYMAPEQALNAKEADERADIYGLGCALYFLLTGKPPFAGRSAFETLIAHREQLPPAIREIRADVPRQLDRLLQRMLAKKPHDRPQSMAQIVDELESLISNGVVEEKENLSSLLTDTRRVVSLKSPKKPRLWSPSRRQVPAWIAACAGAMFGALVIGSGLTWWFDRELQLPPSSRSAARFDVRLVKAAEGEKIKHVSEALRLLAGDMPSKAVVSGRYRFLDFIDPMLSSGGFFDADLAFPGFLVENALEDSNNFALEATAMVSIPRAGAWTFCVVSDDGFQLSIDGTIVSHHAGTRTQAATFMTVEWKEPGTHVLKLVYFEGTGGADLEFCLAEGRYDDFDADAFQLIGASYDGGISVMRNETP